MIAKILPYMRCPQCFRNELQIVPEGLSCSHCHSFYPSNKGIPDMLGKAPDEVITPFQRVMQTPIVVSIYEKLWRRAGYYLASSRSFGEEMETVLRFAKGRCHGRGLDLACGPGVFTRPLARLSQGLVVGLDLSWPMLNQARASVERKGPDNIVFLRATAFNLPFADASFDFINCCGALHLFDRPADALREISRVLQPGAHFIAQTTIRPERSAGFAYFLERFIRFGFFDEQGLKGQLRQAGFSIVESERHRISYTFFAKRD